MIDKLTKYIIGGISNTIFSYFIYCLLVILFNYKVSYFLSILASIIYSYQVNTKLVFVVKRESRFRYLFFLIYLFQLILGIIFIDIWINKFFVSKFIAPLLNIIFISPIAFFLSNSLSRKLKK